MSRTYRWGILGAGKIAAKFASALAYTERAELYAVASRDAERGRQFAGQFSVKQVYSEYASLVEDPLVDVIYIATPHVFHCEQALLCLQHNKAVLCEKPMALSGVQVQQMVSAARKHNSFLMEGMWTRFMPSMEKALSLIADDVIGPVQFVRADFGFEAPPDPAGRLYNKELGGGALLDVGVYTIFLTKILLGQPSRIQAMAKISLTGADEYCNMQFQYAGGQSASIFAGISFQTSLTAELTGTRGRIYIHRPFYKADSLMVELNDGSASNFSYPHEHNGFEYEIREVTNCLDRGYKESPLLSLDFSLQMAQIMDAVREQCGIVY